MMVESIVEENGAPYRLGSIESPSTESFLSLFEQLVRHHSKLTSNGHGRKSSIKDLKDNLHSIFSYKEVKKNSLSLTDVEKLLWYSHTLRRRRKFDDANRLYSHLKYFKDNDLLTETCSLRSVLKFLTCLIDNETADSANQVATLSPWIISSNKETPNLPSEPLCYNDTRLDSAFSRWHYTHFPSRLFTLDSSTLTCVNKSLAWSGDALSGCNKQPGADHAFNFARTEETELSKSAFGALVGPRKLPSPVTPDTALSIPNLPSVPQGYSLHIPSLPLGPSHARGSANTLNHCASHENEIGLVDEGYVSSQCSVAGRSPRGEGAEGDVWERVLRGEGGRGGRRERPFISEAGTEVTHRLWSVQQHLLRTMDPSAPPSACSPVPPDQLCLQVIHVMMGIPSAGFSLTKSTRLCSFEIQDGLCYKGVTPESLRPCLQEFVECGNKVLRIEDFSECSPDEGGRERAEAGTLSLRAFKRALRAFLFYYRQKILLLKGESKLLGLRLRSEALRRKVFFVSQLLCCLLEEGEGCFSSSLALISALQRQLALTRSQASLCLLLSFINAACEPFLVFLEKWIYEGELLEFGTEFLVEVDLEALSSEGRMYWTKGYSLVQGFAEVGPPFLKEVLTQAFICGKSMNLLKICCPQSFLLTKAPSVPRPRIDLCSSLNHVDSTRLRCLSYRSKMVELAGVYQVTLRDLDERERKKEEKLVRESAEAHLAFIREFQERKKCKVAHEIKKKREIFESLKEDLERREVWREERRREEEKREEKAALERAVKEEERNMEELKLRSTLMPKYINEMSALESKTAALQTKLDTLVEGVVSGAALSGIGQEPEGETKEVDKEDNESVSQMSTTSDCLETPTSDDAIGEDVFTNYEAKIGPEWGSNEGGGPGAVLDTATDQPEDNNNYKIEERGEEQDCTNIEEGGHVIEDTLNRNLVQQTHDRALRNTDEIERRTNNNESSKLKTKDEMQIGKDKSTASTHSILFNRNTINAKHTTGTDFESNTKSHKSEAEIVTDSDSNRSQRTTKESDLESNTKSHQTETKTQTDHKSNTKSHKVQPLSKPSPTPPEPQPYPPGTFSNPAQSNTTTTFRIPKSKSESSSLNRGEKEQRKMSQRRSLFFDLGEDEDPVLIDKGGTDDSRPLGTDVSSPNASWAEEDREFLRSVAAAAGATVAPYQNTVHKYNKESLLALSSSASRFGARRVPEGASIGAPNRLPFAPVYLERGLWEHLAVQCVLVNSALLSHFMVERNLLAHLGALKTFLLMADAAFARALTQGILAKFPSGHPGPSLASPVELNGILSEATSAAASAGGSLCSKGGCPYAANLCFVVPPHSPSPSSNPLDSIDLRYRVGWPLNLILDQEVLAAYTVLSKFMARLRQAMWAIEAVFRDLAAIRSACPEVERSAQFHQVCLFRHEVQQFVRVLFGYVSYEAVENSWTSFQRSIREKTSALDELYDFHWRFVNDVTEKCFLTPGSVSVQGLIQEMFCEVLLFRSILRSHPWRRLTENFETAAFQGLKITMDRFRSLAARLNKMLRTLLRYTQSNHVEELVDQLDFNQNFEHCPSSATGS